MNKALDTEGLELELAGASNVLAFVPVRTIAKPEEAPFTGAERALLRIMLAEFATVKQHCPMARKLLD